MALLPPYGAEVDGFDIFADPDEAVLLAERAAQAAGTLLETGSEPIVMMLRSAARYRGVSQDSEKTQRPEPGSEKGSRVSGLVIFETALVEFRVQA